MKPALSWQALFILLLLCLFSAMDPASAAGATGKRQAALTGLAQLANGYPVVGAAIQVEDLAGQKLPVRGKTAATTERGAYSFNTAGLPRRFVVVATGGDVVWQDNGQARRQRLNGALRTVVALKRGQPQAAMLTLGTTAQVAIHRHLKGSKRLDKAGELARQALGWPAWTRLGFDDRVNDDYAQGAKILEAMGKAGGLHKLARKIAAQGAKGQRFLVPYQGGALTGAYRPALLGGAASLVGEGLNMALGVASLVMAIDAAHQLAAYFDQANQDFQILQSEISALQTTLNQAVSAQALENYSSAAAQATANQVVDYIQRIQAAIALPCVPPGSNQTPTNPAPCGPLTYQSKLLLSELDPGNPDGFFAAMNAGVFQGQILGSSVTQAEGVLALGMSAIKSSMKAGAPMTQGFATSLYNSAMSVSVQNLQQTWYALMGAMATLNMQAFGAQELAAYAPQNMGALDNALAALQPALQNQLAVYGYRDSGSQPGTLAVQKSLWAQSIPPNAVVDPSTSLMWWNIGQAIAPDGLTTQQTLFSTQTAAAAYQGFVPPLPTPIGGKLGPACFQENAVPGCAGPFGAWAYPSINYVFYKAYRNGDGQGNCNAYQQGGGNVELGALNPKNNVPAGANPGQAPGLLNSTLPGLAASGDGGQFAQALAAVAPGVFPQVGQIAFYVPDKFAGTANVPPSLGYDCASQSGGSSTAGTTAQGQASILYARFTLTCDADCGDGSEYVDIVTDQSHKSIAPWVSTNYFDHFDLIGQGTVGPYDGYLLNFSPNFITPRGGTAGEYPDGYPMIDIYAKDYSSTTIAYGNYVQTADVQASCYTWPKAATGCAADAWAPPGPVGLPGALQASVAYQPAGTVLLNWTPPQAAGGGGLAGYHVRYTGDLDAAAPTWTSLPGTVAGHQATVAGLAGCAAYRFQVQAVNSINQTGPWSQTSAIANGAAPTPCPPTELVAVPNNAQVQLNWEAPAWNGGSAIQRYNYQYGQTLDGRCDDVIWIGGQTASATAQADITGLTNGDSYCFQVAAVNQGGTPSAWSAVASAQLISQMPGAPTNLSGMAGDARVVLSWNAPADTGDGAAIAAYQVRYSTNNGASWLPFVPAAAITATTATVAPLNNGLSYVFEAAAVNQLGYQGPWSAPSAPLLLTGPKVPSAPTGLSAAPEEIGKVNLDWLEPAYVGDGPVTGYKVEYSSDDGARWTPAAQTFTARQAQVAGLSPGLPYVFHVAALNKAGQGPWSVNSAAVNPDSKTPTAPRNVSAQPTPGQAGQVDLSWQTPSYQGDGAFVTHYLIDYSDNGGAAWRRAEGDFAGPGGTVAGLDSGLGYVFRVAAVNSVDLQGPWSDKSASVTSQGRPKAPTDIVAALSEDKAAVQLTWKAPDNTGGLPAVYYHVRYLPSDGSSNWTLLPGDITGTSTIVDGLTPGINYSFQAAAFNALGQSLWSASSGSAMPVGPPPQTPSTHGISNGPASNIEGGVDDSIITVISPPNMGGAPLIGYKANYSLDQGATWLPVEQLSYVGGLFSGTTSVEIIVHFNTAQYPHGTIYYQFAAVNAYGTGPFGLAGETSGW